MKKNLITLILVVNTLFSYGQPPETIGALYLGSKDLLNGFTSDIDNISQKRLVEAFEMLELLLDQLDGKVKDHMYTLKSDLSKKERELYNSLERLYVTLSKDFNSVLSEVDDVTLTLSNTISSNWLVGNRKPFIKNIKVPYITPRLAEDVEIFMSGVNLNVRKNYIQIDTNKIYAKILPNNNISFRIPKEILANLNVGKIPIQIFTYKRKKLNFKPYEVYDYDILVSNDKIGTIKFITERRVQQKIYDDRTFSVSKKKKASSKKKWKDAPFTIRLQNRQDPTNNWKIDLQSVKKKKTQSADGGSECDIYLNKSTDKYIKGKVQARGTGCCDYKAGTTKCRITWREYYTKQVSVYDTTDIELDLNMDTLVKINQETFDLYAIVIEYGDGTKETFSSISAVNTLPIDIDLVLPKKYILLKRKK